MSSFQWKDQEGYTFPKTDLRTLLSKISLYATKYYNDKPELWMGYNYILVHFRDLWWSEEGVVWGMLWKCDSTRSVLVWF